MSRDPQFCFEGEKTGHLRITKLVRTGRVRLDSLFPSVGLLGMYERISYEIRRTEGGIPLLNPVKSNHEIRAGIRSLLCQFFLASHCYDSIQPTREDGAK
jgi:hypothetical protein